jgi:hypothetical protein
MKKLYSASLLFFLVISFSSNAQVFWTENFGTGCSQGNLANGFTGTNGAWSVANTGTNDTYANTWYVSATEAGTGIGNCGDGCGSNASLINRTLHLGPSPLLGGDAGATYNSGGICGIGICVQTDWRAESPVINCTGYDTITISFNYFMQGAAGSDFAALGYYDGTSWTYYNGSSWTAAFTSLPASNNSLCAGQGSWTAFTAQLPASANNNPNVKIGFRWKNNDDGIGTDPSFAVDDISISGIPGPSCSVFITPVSPLCYGDCNGSMEAFCTGAFPINYVWSNGLSATGDTVMSFTNFCAGVYTVIISDANSCTATAIVTLTQPNPLVLGTLISNNPSCIGCTDGTICLGTLNGGTAPYAINLSPTATFNGNCFLNLGADDYTVCVTDANGCLVCQNDTLTDPPSGIAEHLAPVEIRMYPNPFSETATIEVYGLQIRNYSLVVWDELGREIRKSEIRNQKYEMQRGNLQDGIYFFDLLNDEKQVVARGKFVLQ